MLTKMDHGLSRSDASTPYAFETARLGLDVTELSAALQRTDTPTVVDVREPNEFVGELGHIPAPSTSPWAPSLLIQINTRRAKGA